MFSYPELNEGLVIESFEEKSQSISQLPGVSKSVGLKIQDQKRRVSSISLHPCPQAYQEYWKPGPEELPSEQGNFYQFGFIVLKKDFSLNKEPVL